MTNATNPDPVPERRGYRLVRPRVQVDPRPRLSPEQAGVVATAQGALLVLGGPGTGKTTTLVESVAARVAAGCSPDQILVLTFSRRGALELRGRIEARLAGDGELVALAEPEVRTFHGYAFGLLRRAAVAVGDLPPRLLTGPEQDLVIREMLSGVEPDTFGWPESLRAALGTREFATQLRDLLLRCAERGIGPVRLAGLAASQQRPDWIAAARFYRDYLRVLSLRESTVGGQVGYDYAELVQAAIRLLRQDPDLVLAERRRLAHVYVEELAETDPAQVELLSLLAGDGASLVAFADPDSASFAFRGADRDIVDKFPGLFRDPATGAPAPRAMLTRGYRQQPALRAAARRVATRLRGSVRHRDLAPGPAESSRDGLEVRTFATETQEAAHIANRLRHAKLVEGMPWSQMAVIVRSTSMHVDRVRRALQRFGVPVATPVQDLPLHLQPAISHLLRAIRCALEPRRLDEDAAVALLHSPIGGADPLAERQLRQGLRARSIAAGDRRPSGMLLVEALNDPAVLDGVDRHWAVPAQQVARVLDAVRQVLPAGVEQVLWAAWSATGLVERWSAASIRGGPLGETADRDLDAVVTLFDAAARFAQRLPGSGAEVFADYVEGQDLPADSLATVAERGEVVEVLTAHAAKGREWDLVAVAGVQEGVWPDLRLRGTLLGSEQLVELVADLKLETVARLSGLLDEERRLFYAAITRARRRLLVTAVDVVDSEYQASRFLAELAGGADQVASGPPVSDQVPGALTLPTLVAQLRAALVDPDLSEDQHRAAARLLAELAGAGVAGAAPRDWWGLNPLSDSRPLVDPGKPVRITPSTVESVQRCALRWLLERHGGATAASPEQGLGNLVHAAAMLADQAAVDRATLAAYVANRFDSIELSARWLVGRERQRVDAMLDKLLAWLGENPRRLIGIERDFLVRLADPRYPVEIRGRVDRLEIDEDGRLVVVDLKTGKSAPTTSQLDRHGQLAAYQVAIRAGAFRESDIPGGARLVQLGGSASGAREQAQRPLSEAQDPEWAVELVRGTAETMAAATFEAVANDRCRTCPVTASCPLASPGGVA